jgi:hypothetical protein
MNLKNSVCSIIVVFALGPVAVNALPFDFGGKVGPEEFTWQEFNQSGQKHVEEKGTRTVASGFIRSKLEP